MTAVDDAIKQAEEWANDNRQIYQTAALLAAEVKRLQEALDRCRKGINTWNDK